MKLFLNELNESSGCTFNIQSGRPDKKTSKDNTRCRSKLRGFRECSMNVSHSKNKENLQPGKNTGCPASINFRLECGVGKNISEKQDRINYPLWLNVYLTHNHSVNRAEFFRFQSVSQDTKNAFTDMFNNGLTPSAAHVERRRQLKAQYPDT